MLTISHVEHVTFNPYVTRTKNVQTAVTSTNKIPRYIVEVTIASLITAVDGVNAASAKVDLATHRCYIQRLKEDEDDPKYEKVNVSDVGCRPYVIDEEGDCWVEQELPLQVYYNYKAVMDAKGNQTPILLCLENDETDDTHFFYGPNCTADMFEHLESLAVDIDGNDGNVIVIFHNLKGYDGMFILQHCYATHQDVTDQITVGSKVLSQIRQTDFQRLSMLPTVSTGQLPNHLWADRTM